MVVRGPEPHGGKEFIADRLEGAEPEDLFSDPGDRLPNGMQSPFGVRYDEQRRYDRRIEGGPKRGVFQLQDRVIDVG